MRQFSENHERRPVGQQVEINERQILPLEKLGQEYPEYAHIEGIFGEAYQITEKLVADLNVNGSSLASEAQERLRGIIGNAFLAPLPESVGAAYSPQAHKIFLNALHANKSRLEILRYFKHELLHAIGLEDEGAVDYIAQNVEGDDGVRSGYINLVEKLRQISDKIDPFELLLEYDIEDEVSLANLIYKLFVEPKLERVEHFASPDELRNLIADQFGLLVELFPRLMDRVFETDYDGEGYREVHYDKVLERLSGKIYERQFLSIEATGAIPDMLNDLLLRSKANSQQEFVDALKAEGFGWMLEHETVQVFIEQLAEQNFARES